MSDNKTTSTEGKSKGPATRRRGKILGPEIRFGERIKELRGKKRQADLAREAGIAPSALAKYESGERYPSVPEFRRLCDALKAPPDYLLYGDTAPEYPSVKSAVEEAAARGKSEKDQFVRMLYTVLLLNTLPPREREAFREIIWSTASRHVGKPELFRVLFDFCQNTVDAMGPDLDELFVDKVVSDPKVQETIDDLTRLGEEGK